MSERSELAPPPPCWGGYLQQQLEAGHGPIPQVVQTVPGVVGMEAFGPTGGGETAVLRRQMQCPNAVQTGVLQGDRVTGLTAPRLKGRLQPPQN